MSKYTTPDFAASALVTIDVQRDTLDGQPMAVPGTSAIVPRLRTLLLAFRRAGRPIIHMVRLYQPDGSNVDLCRREQIEQGARFFIAGTPGCELPRELYPDIVSRLDAPTLLAGKVQHLAPGEVVMYKPRWGAFYQTPLESYLRPRGISTLVFAGCNFPNCPRTSIYEASERDFRVVAVEDAISGLDERGKEELRAIGITLLPAAEIARYLH